MVNTKDLDYILRKEDFQPANTYNLNRKTDYTSSIIEIPTRLIATKDNANKKIFYNGKHVGATSHSNDGHLVYGFTNREDIANNLNEIPLYNLELRG